MVKLVSPENRGGAHLTGRPEHVRARERETEQ